MFIIITIIIIKLWDGGSFLVKPKSYTILSQDSSMNYITSYFSTQALKLEMLMFWIWLWHDGQHCTGLFDDNHCVLCCVVRLVVISLIRSLWLLVNCQAEPREILLGSCGCWMWLRLLSCVVEVRTWSSTKSSS